MIDERMRAAMDGKLDEEDKTRLWERIRQAAAEDAPSPSEENEMRNRNVRRIIRITLLVAVITSLLTAGAYAAGFIGSKAIIITDQINDGETLVSITQPQAVPEEMDEAIREKVENARTAWAEWRAWRENSPDLPHEPAVFVPPKDAAISNYVENEDGSFTLSYYGENAFTLIYENESGEPDFSAVTPIEVRTATAEEMAAREEWMQYINLSYGDYDFNYDIHNVLEAEKLEEISAKYGLRLRHKNTLLWSKETIVESEAEMNAKNGTDFHTDTSGPRFLTNQELCERVADTCCHGPLFRQMPRGFDKVYYFDEGTFCVSFDQQLSDGRRVNCYGYNSMYATLSSGREVVSRITEPERFQMRTHTAPDGTVLTVMQKDSEAFVYAYLPDSFFEMHMQSDRTLSDTDVDTVADSLNYRNIGK